MERISSFIDVLWVKEPTILASRFAFLSAGLTWFGVIFNAIAWGILAGTDLPKAPTNGSEWDIPFLQQLWVFRSASTDIVMIGDFISTTALCSFCFCMFVVLQLYKQEKGYLRFIMLWCFVGAAGIAIISFLQTFGIALVTRQISENKEFSQIPFGAGYIALTIAFDIFSASEWFLFIGDLLLNSIGFVILFILGLKSISDEEHRLNPRINLFALVIAIIGFLSLFFQFIFMAAVNGFSRGFGIAFGVFSILLGFILFPIFMVWLGIELRKKTIPVDSGMAKGIMK